MKRFLLLLFAMLSLTAVMKAEEIVEYDFTPNTNLDGWPTSAVTSETTVTSKNNPELTFTFFNSWWAKNAANSYIATKKATPAGYVKIKPFEGKVVTKVQLYLPTNVTNKSTFALFIDGNDKAVGNFTTSAAGSYFNEVEIPAELKSEDNVLVIKTTNTSNQCGFGKIKFTLEDAKPAVSSVVIAPGSRDFEGEQTVTITAYNAEDTAIDGAEIFYSLNSGDEQTGVSPVELTLTETTVVKARAKDVEVVEATFTKVVPDVKPDAPVLLVDGMQVENDVELFYGTEATVYSKNATSVSVNGDEKEGDRYTFTVTATASIEAYGINGDKESDATEFNIILKNPELNVSCGELTFENDGEYSIKQNSVVTVSATGAKEITVANEDGEIALTDNAFALVTEGLYIFTATNGENETSVMVTLNIEFPEAFYRLTDVSYLKEGDKVLLVCDSKSQNLQAASNAVKANNRDGVNVKFSEPHKSIVPEENTNVLILEIKGTEGEWQFMTTNYNADTQGFLTMDTSTGSKQSNALRVDATASDCNKSKISIDTDGNAKVEFNSTGRNIICYNSTNAALFSCYAAANVSKYEAIQLYINDAVAAEPVVEHVMNESGTAVEAVKVTVPKGLHVQYIHNTSAAADGASAAAEEIWNTVESNEHTVDLSEAAADNLNSEIKFRATDPSTGRTSPVHTVNINADGNISGITGIEAEDCGEAVYFNLQGVRVDEPACGLYLRRTGNKVEKVTIR